MQNKMKNYAKKSGSLQLYLAVNGLISLLALYWVKETKDVDL